MADQKENLSFVEQRQVEELKRSYDRLSRIPADEYMDYAMLTNEASDVAQERSSDFTLSGIGETGAITESLRVIMTAAKSRMMHCWMNMNAVWIWPFWIHFFETDLKTSVLFACYR